MYELALQGNLVNPIMREVSKAYAPTDIDMHETATLVLEEDLPQSNGITLPAGANMPTCCLIASGSELPPIPQDDNDLDAHEEYDDVFQEVWLSLCEDWEWETY